MHPQNRFWKVLSRLYQEDAGQSVRERNAFLHRQGIAVWDCIQSCTLCGSSDASLRDVTVNDIGALLKNTNLQRIFCNGKGAYQIYRRYVQPITKIEAVPLPSTSPANAAWSLDRLCTAWQVLLAADIDSQK